MNPSPDQLFRALDEILTGKGKRFKFTANEAEAKVFVTGASARRVQAAYYKATGIMLPIIKAKAEGYLLFHPDTEECYTEW